VTGLVRSSVRPATDADQEAVRAISAAYDNLRPWPERPDFLDHEFGEGRIVVAEWNGEVVAFGGTFDRGEVVYLADLFVRPDYVGHGAGSAVLEALFDRGEVRLTAASGDPRALPLYARFGMRPLMPALYLHGAAGGIGPLGAAPESLAPAPPEAIAEIDAELCGRPRPQEHAFLASCAGAEGFVLDASGGPDGYGWTRTVSIDAGSGPERHAFVGPVGGRTEDAMDRVTRALATRALETAPHVHLLLLGPHPSLAALLSGGFRLVDRDTWMCSRFDLVDGRRYAPSPELG
jgi:GNAT superfamily N-acetyltransferase